MSTDLYQTALVWYAQRGGVARLWGRQVPLVDAPTLAGLRLTMLEYFPEIGQMELQEATGPRRAMTADEIAAADGFLRAAAERSA